MGFFLRNLTEEMLLRKWRLVGLDPRRVLLSLLAQTFKPYFTLKFCSASRCDLRRFRVWMHRERILTGLVSSTRPERKSTHQISPRTAFGNFERFGHLSGVPKERPEKIAVSGQPETANRLRPCLSRSVLHVPFHRHRTISNLQAGGSGNARAQSQPKPYGTKLDLIGVSHDEK